METYLALARAHAPLLIVVLPFLASALVVVANGQRIGWLIATAAALVGAALAVDLCWRTFSGNAAIYVAHEGLAIAANALGTFSIAILSFASCSIVIAVGAVLRIGSRAASFGLALILCAGGAWAGAALAQDFTTFFVFIEAAWLSCVGVVALLGRENRGALNGALRMLFDGGIASVLLLLGIGLMERGLGSTLIASITSERLSAPNTVSLGVALSVTALALMAGSAPLSAWAGAAYGRAGGVAALLIGAMGSAGALLALMHVAIAAMPAPAIGAGLGFALCVLGVMSATIGSAQAVGAKNIQRLGGYAISAQVGCVLIGVGLGSPAGLEAATLQIVALSGAALALFGAAALAGCDGGLDSLDGLGRRAPVAGVVMTTAALSLMGAPLTLSFLARWRLMEAALGVGWWWAAGAAIAVSLTGSLYGGRIIERIYFRRASQSRIVASGWTAWKMTLWPAAALGVITIVSALEPSLLVRMAGAAAQTLVEAAP